MKRRRFRESGGSGTSSSTAAPPPLPPAASTSGSGSASASVRANDRAHPPPPPAPDGMNGSGLITCDPGIDLHNQAWMHDVFVCPLHGDAGLGMVEYARSTKLVEDRILISGDPAGATTTRARTNLLQLLRHWFDVLWRLRQAGFTLRGNFTPENFMVYAATMDVRMNGSLHISRYSPEDGSEDHRSFVWSVRQVLTLRESIPPHIHDWLNLVNDARPGEEYLIRYNISLMQPRLALSTLMSLRGRLEDLECHNQRVYHEIMMQLTAYNTWQDNRSGNALIESTRRHTERQLRRRGKRQIEAFHPSVRGILTVIRHCSQHKGRRYEDLMVFIIEHDFRHFASQFQRVMFNNGQLEFLSLQTSMR